MKIVISTYHASHNYGAVLQANALATYLRDIHSAEVSFLNYRPPESMNAYKLFVPFKGLPSLRHNLNTLKNYRSLKDRSRAFVSFQQKHFKLTREYGSLAQIVADPPDADAFITGSDQVFRYKGAVSEPYYLAFCPELEKRSIAYAPSFGASTVSPAHSARVAQLLRDLDHLSCRENAGAALIRELTGLEVPVVVDPVFLLPREQWLGMSANPGVSGAYILVYALVGYKEQLKLAARLKSLQNLPIVLIHGVRVRDKVVNSCFCSASPEQFVGLFANASCVVTDSFHGTAFSLLLQKDFFSYIAVEKSSARIRNLLDEIGLTSRIAISPDSIQACNLSIDYADVETRLSLLIGKSKQYLDQALLSVEGDV